jgi:uncharacterized membrane protein
MFENRRWLVIPTSLTGSINFNQVLESSIDTLRYSIDGTQTFVKYEINIVTASYEEYYQDTDTDTWVTESISVGVYGRPSIYSEEYTEYTHEEILNLLSTSDWVLPVDESGSLD